MRHDERHEGAVNVRASWGMVRGMIFLAASLFGGGGLAEAADAIRGGLMYDKWWDVTGAEAPTGEHPLYPIDVNVLRGSDTFRCKECHGWDYKGAAGAYSKGSHFTGIRGVYGSTKTAQEMFDILKNPPAVTANGHDMASYGLSDEDVDDLVEFLTAQLLDTDEFVGPGKTFKGDASEGAGWYNHVDTGACANCHGADGTRLNFGDEEEPEWVGTIAFDNPWEFIHKVRFGHPASIMPSWTEHGGSNQGAANIGAYVQKAELPVAPEPEPEVLGNVTVTSGSASLKKGRWQVKVSATYTGFDGVDPASLKIEVDGADPFAGQTGQGGANGKVTIKAGGNKATLQASKQTLKLALKSLPADALDPSDGVEVAVQLDGRKGSVVVPVTIEDVTLTEATGAVSPLQ
jgi:thiosulfate dehydrogenase